MNELLITLLSIGSSICVALVAYLKVAKCRIKCSCLWGCCNVDDTFNGSRSDTINTDKNE